MTTKWCMNCDSEYLTTVEVCPDCDIALIERDGPDEDQAAGGALGGQRAYELNEWAVESRAMLDQLLEAAAIPRAWEGATLVIPVGCEPEVDELVAQVEATTLASLDPDKPKVAYDLSDWTDAQVTALAEALGAVALPYEFDLEDSLVVHEEDEERVDEMLDSIEFPDVLKPDMDGEDEIDGVDVSEVMSDLFVAVDRLRKHARAHEGVLAVVAAADAIEHVDVPFGFAPEVWQDIQGQAVRLREVLEEDSETDEEIEARAEDLRTVLRSYV